MAQLSSDIVGESEDTRDKGHVYYGAEASELCEGRSCVELESPAGRMTKNTKVSQRD